MTDSVVPAYLADHSLADQSLSDGTLISDLLSTTYFGIPVWGWVLGGVLVLLLLAKK